MRIPCNPSEGEVAKNTINHMTCLVFRKKICTNKISNTSNNIGIFSPICITDNYSGWENITMTPTLFASIGEKIRVMINYVKLITSTAKDSFILHQVRFCSFFEKS